MSIAGRILRVLLAVGLTLLLLGCASLPSPTPNIPVGPEQVSSLADLPDRLVTLIKSNQIVFRKSGAVLEPVCWCGPKVYSHQIAKTMKQAIVAIEDRHFYGHRGIDPTGILRATWKTVSSGFSDIEGGSTITAQLIKNAALTSTQDAGRKVSEALLAWTLEGHSDKEHILEWYLNQVAYGYDEGHPVVGVEQAARHYFGRSAEDLSLLESAILAGMVQAPTELNLFKHKDRAMKRARMVLQAMVDTGDITKKQMARALKSERPRGSLQPIWVEARSYIEWVLGQIKQEIPGITFDTSTRIPIALQVISQAKAEKAYGEALENLPVDGEETSYVTMGFDGEVIVMIGQKDFGETQLNLVTQTNSQAASTFKPIVYAAAFESGEAKASGRLTEMLAKSDNETALRLAAKTGIDVVANLARSMGITSSLREDLSLALGTSEVSLLEMVSAYVPFANGGMTAKPYGHYGIIKKGDVVAWTVPESHRAISAKVAEAVRRMLRAVVTSGTGLPANISKSAAGKTGTSDGNRDAWFIGMTSRHVSGVWVGRLNDAPMSGISGTAAAEIWGRIERALPNE